jgi:hypothetical protein
MELNFIKDGNVFIAEFEVAGDFNLHVERKERGIFSVYQRTALNGKYAYVEDLGSQTGKGVIEYDFTGVIYPKMIKIVSEVNPTIAEVTSIGEVTEIKSQSKEVEVTANGTMDITPDAGFAYLNSVKVKTNVAQSGEGGGTAFKYHKLNWDSPLSDNMGALFLYAGQFIVNNVIVDNSGILINAGVAVLANYMVENESMQSVKAIITCPFPLENEGEFKTYTIEQFFAQMGAEGSAMLEELLIPITEEEYYNKETYA